MCETILWALNAAGYTAPFVAETERRLGVAPQETDLRIASDAVRASAVHFALTPRQCDCDALVGLGERPASPGDITPSALLGWIHDLPDISPAASRLVVLRAWSPTGPELVPAQEEMVAAADVTEDLLRSVPDDGAVVVEYPWRSSTARRG